MMKNKIKFLIIALLFCCSAVTIQAQPTITFFPVNGTTLTYAMVSNSLDNLGLTRASQFHAICSNTVVIDFAFHECTGLLSIDLGETERIIGGVHGL